MKAAFGAGESRSHAGAAAAVSAFQLRGRRPTSALYVSDNTSVDPDRSASYFSMPDRLRPPSNPDTIVGRSQLQLSLAELLSAMSLVEFTNFMNNAAALEKFLKLLQGFAQLGMSVFASAQLVETSTLLRKHFALGRRYFRVFKWIDCALVASAALCGDANGGKEGVLAMLNVAKWSYLGMFLFTEALTLVCCQSFFLFVGRADFSLH